MKRRLTGIALPILLMLPATLPAAETSVESDPLLNLRLDARFDYQRDWNDGHAVKENSGFDLPYFMLRLDGTIVPGLSYSWRQRFNKDTFNGNFFRATDWLFLSYAYRRWEFSAGKEPSAIGGFEYDRAPYDLYSSSLFWNGIPCWNLGVSAGYDITSRDQLKLQVTQSPFHTHDNRDMYAYNLMWTGHHGFYQSLWSANLSEYSEGRYISYLSLGNRFTVGPCALELDLMNRAASGQTFFFKDVSVIGELSWRPTSRWNIFAKMTYDVNRTDKAADLTVLPGTELTMAGAGVEFFPLVKDRTSLRLHANLFYAWGTNTNAADVMQNKSMILNVGVKWDMNILSLKRK